MTDFAGGERLRLDGNSAAGMLREVFAVEMTMAACTCAACRRVSTVGALYLYGGPTGCVLRCPNCEALVLCMTSLPTGRYIAIRGTLRTR